SGPTARGVASSATAFALFSQNSAGCRWPGSGQAHPGQSKPCFWLTAVWVSRPRRAPYWAPVTRILPATAGHPTADSLGAVTLGASWRGSSMGALDMSGPLRRRWRTGAVSYGVSHPVVPEFPDDHLPTRRGRRHRGGGVACGALGQVIGEG